jgi:hypothetical protein
MFVKETIPLIARPFQKVAHDETFRLWDEGVSGVLNRVFHWRSPPEDLSNAGPCAVGGNDVRLVDPPKTKDGRLLHVGSDRTAMARQESEANFAAE